MKSLFTWLSAVPLENARDSPEDFQVSFGFGDRLGLATPGHISALRVAGESSAIAPIFAQESVRENARTGRTPQEVMNDALWGVFLQGWESAWGADADHLKQISDLPVFFFRQVTASSQLIQENMSIQLRTRME